MVLFLPKLLIGAVVGLAGYSAGKNNNKKKTKPKEKPKEKPEEKLEVSEDTPNYRNPLLPETMKAGKIRIGDSRSAREGLENREKPSTSNTFNPFGNILGGIGSLLKSLTIRR